MQGAALRRLKKLAEGSPLRRVVEPEDVARTIMGCVLYMKTSTGVKVVCDGGRFLGVSKTDVSTMTNETHDPSRKSFVESANDGKTDFPIQNLPFGVFRAGGSHEAPRVGIAIGDRSSICRTAPDCFTAKRARRPRPA